MSVSTVTKDQFKSFVAALIDSGQKVVGPQAKDDKFVFGALTNADDLRLDYDVTILPPKKYFQPPRETLLKFDRKEGFESVSDNQPFVLFGVHPYDMVAISQMDKLFTTDNCIMNDHDRQKMCWNCDASVSRDATYCPLCGCDLMVNVRSEKAGGENRVVEAAKQAINNNVTRYTPVGGMPDLRKAVANKFQKINNINYDPSEILISCGGKHSLYNICSAILNPEDEAILPVPYWVSFEEMIKQSRPTNILAGDIFCSGTPTKTYPASKGDRTEIEIQALGTLST